MRAPRNSGRDRYRSPSRRTCRQLRRGDLCDHPSGLHRGGSSASSPDHPQPRAASIEGRAEKNRGGDLPSVSHPSPGRNISGYHAPRNAKGMPHTAFSGRSAAWAPSDPRHDDLEGMFQSAGWFAIGVQKLYWHLRAPIPMPHDRASKEALVRRDVNCTTLHPAVLRRTRVFRSPIGRPTTREPREVETISNAERTDDFRRCPRTRARSFSPK